MSKLALWFKETRPQFLILSVVLTFLGTVIAWYHGSFNIWYALLAGLGLTLTHGSVNAINVTSITRAASTCTSSVLLFPAAACFPKARFP